MTRLRETDTGSLLFISPTTQMTCLQSQDHHQRTCQRYILLFLALVP